MIEGDIRKSVIVDAPPETIFRALTDPRELIEWFPREAKIAAHEEGEYEFKTGDPRSGVDIVTHGRILRLIPNKMLSMSWNSDSIPGSESVVTWILDPLPSGKTSVTLVHSGLPSRSRDKVGSEWAVLLGLLQTHYQVAAAKAGSSVGAVSQTGAPARMAKSSWALNGPRASVMLALVVILIAASSFATTPNGPLQGHVIQLGNQCSQSGTTGFRVQVYVTNEAPWTNPGGGTSRDLVQNNFVVTSIDVADSQNLTQSGTFTISYNLTYPIPLGTLGHFGKAVWNVTANFMANRWNPIVLPGETTAIFYYGLVCDTSYTLGPHQVRLTINGMFQGRPTSITSGDLVYSYTVTP